MIKASEVQKELEALGCQAENAKNLLIACGILEDDKPDIQVHDVWETRSGRFLFITSKDSNGYVHGVFSDHIDSTPSRFSPKEQKENNNPHFIKLIWREK